MEFLFYFSANTSGNKSFVAESSGEEFLRDPVLQKDYLRRLLSLSDEDEDIVVDTQEFVGNTQNVRLQDSAEETPRRNLFNFSDVGATAAVLSKRPIKDDCIIGMCKLSGPAGNNHAAAYGIRKNIASKSCETLWKQIVNL